MVPTGPRTKGAEMAVRYKFQTNKGIVERRMLIPEGPEEKLRGQTYNEDMIEWLHNTEQTNIMAEVERQKSADSTVEFVRLWAEIEDGGAVVEETE
jgi:hypothetical protein